MVLREIVQIDEGLCNGCGICIPNCAEGALQMVDGKARLIRDEYCDGLGACLGYCPQGAINIIQRETDPFDEEAVHRHLSARVKQATAQNRPAPHTVSTTIGPSEEDDLTVKSSLSHWPVQLNLVPARASFFDEADLLVLADCVPVAYPNLHTHLLPGRSVVIGCPKFDNSNCYLDKLRRILVENDIRRVTVAHMEVPCCSALNTIANRAMESSDKSIPLRRLIITVGGELK